MLIGVQFLYMCDIYYLSVFEDTGPSKIFKIQMDKVRRRWK